MIYPKEFSKILQEIKPFIEEWPFPVAFDHVMKWILQFNPDDYDIPVRIIKHLTVMGTQEIRVGLQSAYRRLIRESITKQNEITKMNTIYSGIGKESKSGGLIAYHFRVALELPELNFIGDEDVETFDPKKVSNFVLLDDIIGTGKTSAEEVKCLAEEVYPLQQGTNIYVVTVCGYKEGIEHIMEKTQATVICGYEFTEEDTIRSLDGRFYEGLSHLKRGELNERIGRYGRQISSGEFGHGKLGGLLAFEYNTPNTTIPLVWSSGKQWYPLFQRAKNISGIQRFFDKFSDERKKQKSEITDIDPKAMTLTIFVEGKFDKYFFDYLTLKHDLANKIGVSKINAVALGGLYQSERLLKLLSESRKNAIMCLDGDYNTMRLIERIEGVELIPTYHFTPNLISLFDINKLLSGKETPSPLPDFEGSPEELTEQHYYDIERRLFKQGPFSSAFARIAQAIDLFLNIEKYDDFCHRLKEKINELIEKRKSQTTNNGLASDSILTKKIEKKE